MTPSNHYLDPILIALLIVLRSNQATLFYRFVSGKAPPEEIMEFLSTLPKEKESRWERFAVVMHAYLLLADPDRNRSQERIQQLTKESQDNTTPESDKQYASSLLSMRNSIAEGSRRWEDSLAWVANKIDLAGKLHE